MMKNIDNDYFRKFCDVIRRSLLEPSKDNDCLSNMVDASKDNDCLSNMVDASKDNDCLSNMFDASKDDNNNTFVYDIKEINMEVIKLDECTKYFNQKRRSENPELKEDHQPMAVDAVCVNKKNEWYLIEFKNEPIKNILKSTPKKMLSSLWLIAFLYSKLSEKIDTESDILKFAREKVTFITVVSSKKNEDYDEAIGAEWGEDVPRFTPEKFIKYKGYYFKDVYVLTESGLRFFIQKFDS